MGKFHENEDSFMKYFALNSTHILKKWSNFNSTKGFFFLENSEILIGRDLEY